MARSRNTRRFYRFVANGGWRVTGPSAVPGRPNACIRHGVYNRTLGSGEGARLNDGSYKSLNALMRHMRDQGVQIGGSAQKRALAQVGCFHGYKGYRWSGRPDRRIPFSDFSEILAVMEFDARLKAMLYPVLMRIEMTMKNLALVEILDAARSSSVHVIYSELMHASTKKERTRKLELIQANNDALLKAYKRRNPIASHYFESEVEAVPIWGLLEIMTLGHFARFLEQLDGRVLSGVAHRWGMHRQYGSLVPHLVFAVTDLRNAVAHNGVVFDTRFSTREIRREIRDLLQNEVGLVEGQLKFSTVTDYVVLVAYLARALGFTKREIQGWFASTGPLSTTCANECPRACSTRSCIQTTGRR